MVQPLGCVGIVAPWNYPLFLSAGPLIDALGAGNRVIVKPSELTPRFSALFDRLITDAFDPALVGVALGGPAVAQAAVRAEAGSPGVHRVHPCRPAGDARGGG